MTVTHNGEDYCVILTEGLENIPDAAKIRTEVFIEEQGFTDEFDDIDPTAVHCLVTKDGVPAATGRLYSEDGIAHIGRVAVVRDMRGKGLGSVVISILERYAAEKGFRTAALSAQCRVQKFYEANGYRAEGDIYYDEYCPHIMMYKTLAEKGDGPMTKTIKIEGMKCGHCEAAVKKALEAVEGVISAKADKDSGTAVVELSCDTDAALLRKAVEDEDFTVLGIE